MIGDLEVDPEGFRARKNGRNLDLTATEFRLLLELARRPGQAFTRELLLERVWNYDYLGDSRLVDVAVQRLRAKVEDDPRTPNLIVTVRGRLPLREAVSERQRPCTAERLRRRLTLAFALTAGSRPPRWRPGRSSSSARHD